MHASPPLTHSPRSDRPSPSITSSPLVLIRDVHIGSPHLRSTPPRLPSPETRSVAPNWSHGSPERLRSSPTRNAAHILTDLAPPAFDRRAEENSRAASRAMRHVPRSIAEDRAAPVDQGDGFTASTWDDQKNARRPVRPDGLKGRGESFAPPFDRDVLREIDDDEVAALGPKPKPAGESIYDPLLIQKTTTAGYPLEAAREEEDDGGWGCSPLPFVRPPAPEPRSNTRRTRMDPPLQGFSLDDGRAQDALAPCKGIESRGPEADASPASIPDTGRSRMYACGEYGGWVSTPSDAGHRVRTDPITHPEDPLPDSRIIRDPPPHLSRRHHPHRPLPPVTPLYRQHPQHLPRPQGFAPHLPPRPAPATRSQSYHAEPMHPGWRQPAFHGGASYDEALARDRLRGTPFGGRSKKDQLGSVADSWGAPVTGAGGSKVYGMFEIEEDPPSRSTSPFRVDRAAEEQAKEGHASADAQDRQAGQRSGCSPTSPTSRSRVSEQERPSEGSRRHCDVGSSPEQTPRPRPRSRAAAGRDKDALAWEISASTPELRSDWDDLRSDWDTPRPLALRPAASAWADGPDPQRPPRHRWAETPLVRRRPTTPPTPLPPCTPAPRRHQVWDDASAAGRARIPLETRDSPACTHHVPATPGSVASRDVFGPRCTVDTGGW